MGPPGGSMRRRFVFVALALLAASDAAAGMVNLRWNDCWGDGGTMNRVFACNVNTGSESLVGSFIPQINLTDVSGIEITVDLATAGATLAPWWDFKNVGT